MPATLSKVENDKIDALFDATKRVVKTLAPLSSRAQRRILNYFIDLTSDPDEGRSLSEAELLIKVDETLLSLRK